LLHIFELMFSKFFCSKQKQDEQEFEATHSWILASSQNELKVKHPPHETPPLKSGKIRVSRVSSGPHNFVVYESGETKKQNKTKDKRTTIWHPQKFKDRCFLASCKKVYIYNWSHVRQVNVEDINNSLVEINICRLCMFVLSFVDSSCLSFFLCSLLLRST
jgi:hypothetical protein